MSKPTTAELSDRQVNALRTFTNGTTWEKGRVHRGTVESLIKRTLLARRPHPNGWGAIYITEAGTAALRAFASGERTAAAPAPKRDAADGPLSPLMQRALQLVCVGHGAAANARSLAALVRRGLITDAQYRSDHRLTEAGRVLAAEETVPAEWAPQGTSGERVCVRKLEPNDAILVAHSFGGWMLASVTDTQRYAVWATVLSRRGRTVSLRIELPTTTEGATLRARADNTLVVRRTA
jgi:hypothetical protein